MLVACVHILVKPEHITEFIAASRENATNTILEPGFTFRRDPAGR